MRLATLSLLVLVAIGACAQSAQAQEHAASNKRYDLATLTQKALDHYPGLRARGAALDAAEAQLNEARYSPFFRFEVEGGVGVAPEVTGSPIYSRDDQFPVDSGWQPVYRIGLSGAVPLWTFGKLSSLRDAAQAGVDAAQAERSLSVNRLRRDVRRTYYGLAAALDTLFLLEEGRKKLAEAEAKLEQALAEQEENDEVEASDPPSVKPSDRYRLTMALAELDTAHAQAKRAEESARRALELLTGVSKVRIPECPLEAIETPPLAQAEAQAKALESRPEFQQLDAAKAARAAQRNAAQAAFFPDLALALWTDYSYGPGITDQNNPFIRDPANYFSIGAAVVAKWSLDLAGHMTRLERAQAQQVELAAQKEEAAIGIQLAATDAHAAVTESSARVKTWTNAAKEARKWFVASTQAYDLGTLEARELLDAAKAYFNARGAQILSIKDHNTRVATLVYETAQETSVSTWEVKCD